MAYSKAVFTKYLLKATALWVLVLVSAVCVSFSVHQTRQAVGELRVENQKHDQLSIEWEMLLLELSTLGGYSRIESSAIRDLGMRTPSSEKVRVIELN